MQELWHEVLCANRASGGWWVAITFIWLKCLCTHCTQHGEQRACPQSLDANATLHCTPQRSTSSSLHSRASQAARTAPLSRCRTRGSACPPGCHPHPPAALCTSTSRAFLLTRCRTPGSACRPASRPHPPAVPWRRKQRQSRLLRGAGASRPTPACKVVRSKCVCSQAGWEGALFLAEVMPRNHAQVAQYVPVRWLVEAACAHPLPVSTPAYLLMMRLYCPNR